MRTAREQQPHPEWNCDGSVHRTRCEELVLAITPVDPSAMTEDFFLEKSAEGSGSLTRQQRIDTAEFCCARDSCQI